MKTTIDYMSKYSIKDLENLTGIKAHTLRIWEQRYGIIEPKRTPTNIRFYDSSDLKSVLKIAKLREHGFKISKIASMAPEQINQQIDLLNEQESTDTNNYIHFLTTAMIDLDEDLFERTLSTCILQLGLETTMYNIIHPFLSKIGTLWQTEAINPAQEHFISCLLRQKLIVAIDGQKPHSHPDGKKFLLYLPEGELHELSLLFSCYLLKKVGHQVIYLGQNLPFTDLCIAYQVYQPHFILGICTNIPTKDLVQSYINDLSNTFPKATIFISGFAIINIESTIPPNVVVLNQLVDLREKIPQI
jgi:DNA-binding transcriptional MerR regulator